MIERLEGMPEGVLGFRAVGVVSAEDYRDVLDPAIDAALAVQEKVHLVVVMGPDFDRMSLGAMWQDAMLAGRPWSSWGRAALVTDHDVLAGVARAFGGLVPGDFKVFRLADQDDAVAWVAEGSGVGSAS
jgi:hypothetical protein